MTPCLAVADTHSGVGKTLPAAGPGGEVGWLNGASSGGV